MAKLYAANQLLKNRLIRFGLAEERADQIARNCALPNPHAKRGNMGQSALHLRSLKITGLALAEHVARYATNWDRGYHVDPTRLAMQALDAGQ